MRWFIFNELQGRIISDSCSVILIMCLVLQKSLYQQLCMLCRKKVQDFYQRTSLTAYCTAFAYRPLTRGVNSQLSQVYLELPADSKHLYVPNRSPTPLAWDFHSVLDSHCRGMLGHFHSTGACSLLNRISYGFCLVFNIIFHK